MTTGSDLVRRAEGVARRLAASMAGREGVVFVDVGRHPDDRRVVVRVHVRAGSRPPDLPASLDGVDVIILTTDARMESNH